MTSLQEPLKFRILFVSTDVLADVKALMQKLLKFVRLKLWLLPEIAILNVERVFISYLLMLLIDFVNNFDQVVAVLPFGYLTELSAVLGWVLVKEAEVGRHALAPFQC